MKEVTTGNHAAFNLLYQRYSGKLFGYFYRYLGNDRSKAEDFLQELFLKVIHHSGTFDVKKGQKVSTWLYAIATNLCRNESRDQLNRSKLLRTFEPWERETAKSIADHMESKELLLSLNLLISELEPNEQQILLLRFQQELSIREIAAIINIPEGTVKSKIFYLLKKMAQQLKTSTSW